MSIEMTIAALLGGLTGYVGANLIHDLRQLRRSIARLERLEEWAERP